MHLYARGNFLLLHKALGKADTRHRVESRLSVKGCFTVPRGIVSPAIIGVMRSTVHVLLIGRLRHLKEFLSLFWSVHTGPPTGDRRMFSFIGSQAPVTNQRFSHTNEAYDSPQKSPFRRKCRTMLGFTQGLTD